MRNITLITLLAIGCDTWPDQGSTWIDQALWDDAVVATTDGLYVSLPRAGLLARVNEDGSYNIVDMNGAVPDKLIPGPDGASVVAFARWPSCDDPDPEITKVSQCAEGDLHWNAELEIIADGAVTKSIDIPNQMNAIAFSGDGKTAVTYLDYDSGDAIPDVEGIVDLTEVVFVPLEGEADAQAVSIGFSPSQILFTEDNDRAVIMSRSKVVVVDLSTYEKLVDYPLTLDPDQQVNPSDAILTPLGDYALVSIDGQSELYVLDLTSPNIDIEDLTASPSDLAPWSTGAADDPGITFISYGKKSRVDILNHDSFELDEEYINLDEPVDHIITGDDFAVFYNTSTRDTHDVYRYDIETTELVEYNVDNPVDSLQVSEAADYAVGVLRPEGTGGSSLDQYQDAHWGLAVIPLAGDEATSLLIQSEPVGLALTQSDETTHALVLMDGVDTLLHVDLAAPSAAEEIDLPAPPTGIGAMPDGRFYVTHSAPLGMISFLDPTSNAPTTVSGFAVPELMPDDTLPRRDTQEK